MKLITLYLPETYIAALDQLVEAHFYPTRAEAIRTSIRDLIKSEVWSKNTAPVNNTKLPKKTQLAILEDKLTTRRSTIQKEAA